MITISDEFLLRRHLIDLCLKVRWGWHVVASLQNMLVGQNWELGLHDLCRLLKLCMVALSGQSWKFCLDSYQSLTELFLAQYIGFLRHGHLILCQLREVAGLGRVLARLNSRYLAGYQVLVDLEEKIYALESSSAILVARTGNCSIVILAFKVSIHDSQL